MAVPHKSRKQTVFEKKKNPRKKRLRRLRLRLLVLGAVLLVYSCSCDLWRIQPFRGTSCGAAVVAVGVDGAASFAATSHDADAEQPPAFVASSSPSTPDSSSSSHHLDENTIHDKDSEYDGDSRGSSNDNNSFLLLCLTDGSIYSLSAWTGEYQSVIHTDPLLQTHHHHHHQDADHDCDAAEDEETRTSSGNTVIVPGLDGRLYWRPPVGFAGSSASSSSSSPPPPPGALQELPLTVSALLENPVRSCNNDDDDDDEECGILTAQAVTSLLALSATGELLWKTAGAGASHSNNNNNNNRNQQQPLLLQRKDYWVQHVRAINGQMSWNVSLGTYQALDFDLAQDPQHQPDDRHRHHHHLLDDDDDFTNNNNNNDDDDILLSSSSSSILPGIVFANAGKTLTAVDPATESVLWRQDVPSTLAAVFGIHRGQWKTVQVLLPSSSQQEQEEEDDSASATTTTASAAAESSSSSPNLPIRSSDAAAHRRRSVDVSEYEQFLWQSQQRLWAAGQQRQDFQRSLPSGGPSLGGGDDSAEQRVCVVGTDGSCPNLKHQLPLRLPSHPPLPTPVAAAAFVQQQQQQQQQPEGLLLSWWLVGAFLVAVVFATAVGVRFWYLRKKAKWMAEHDARNNTKTKNTVATEGWNGMSPLKGLFNNSINKRHMKRSNSLPGTLGFLVPEPLQLTPLLKSEAAKSDDGSVPNSSVKPLLLLQQKQTSADSSGHNSGIPLVRYSRYASEFQELQALGKGGFGSVFACKNTLDGRDYAVKKVSIRGTTDEFQQQLQRVLREVKILAVLDHPNIVRYYTAWLEIEERDGQKNDGGGNSSCNEVGVENTSTYENKSGRHSFSSSLLLNSDSVSGWDTSRPQGRGNYSSLLHHRNQNNPLGWNTGVDLSEGSSCLPRRRSLRHNVGGPKDDWMIFEDSKEEREQSSAELLRNSGAISQDNIRDTISRRSNDDDDESASALAESVRTLLSRKDDESVAAAVVIRHTLYIQMQLCSQKTVADFLADPETRRGPMTEMGVDIPKALRLFLQIVEATQYVHARGLIHRDLKPNNCFMDESCSTVKVGDFGLSRESSSDDESLPPQAQIEISPVQRRKDTHDDHTAGVGTRSYASPEQMNGSDYDSSTDVYSLGIILFELLYPMYTGMERHICLSKLREGTFPADWESSVGMAFPTMKDLTITMLSGNPADRPTAESVARHVQSVLGEFTILSLDQQHYHNSPDMVLIRVEAEHRDDALRHTMQLIRDESSAADAPVDIVQYGMRSSSSNNSTAVLSGGDSSSKPAAIMEFALRYSSSSGSSPHHHRSASNLVRKLGERPEILKARHVSGTSSSSNTVTQS